MWTSILDPRTSGALPALPCFISPSLHFIFRVETLHFSNSLVNHLGDQAVVRFTAAVARL